MGPIFPENLTAGPSVVGSCYARAGEMVLFKEMQSTSARRHTGLFPVGWCETSIRHQEGLAVEKSQPSCDDGLWTKTLRPSAWGRAA